MAHYVDVKLPRNKLTSMMVYPSSIGGTQFKLQTVHRMIMVDTEAGTLTYSKSVPSYSNFYGLSTSRGAKTIEACPDLVKTLLNLDPLTKKLPIFVSGQESLVG